MKAADLQKLTRAELRIRLTAAETVILAPQRTRPGVLVSERVSRAAADRLEILKEIARRDAELTATLESMNGKRA